MLAPRATNSHYVKGPLSVQIVDFEKANFEFLKSQLFNLSTLICGK